MTLKDFFKKYKASDRDKKITNKLFGSEEKTEKEWVDFLEDKIVIQKHVPTKADLKAEIAKKKSTKNKSDEKSEETKK